MTGDCWKRGFDSKEAARQELARTAALKRDGYAHREERSCYQCPDCGAWHLTKDAPDGVTHFGAAFVPRSRVRRIPRH